MNEASLVLFLGEWGSKWVWVVLKWVVVLGLLVYTGFGMMIVRQVDLMNETLNGEVSGFLKKWARGYLWALVLVNILAVVFL